MIDFRWGFANTEEDVCSEFDINGSNVLRDIDFKSLQEEGAFVPESVIHALPTQLHCERWGFRDAATPLTHIQANISLPKIAQRFSAGLA